MFTATAAVPDCFGLSVAGGTLQLRRPRMGEAVVVQTGPTTLYFGERGNLSMMKRLHLVITGDVQGVGYRAWVKREAKRFALTGWVKNRRDGAVEITAEGRENDLQDFLNDCAKGPEMARVTGISETWSDATGEFVNFDVLY